MLSKTLPKHYHYRIHCPIRQNVRKWSLYTESRLTLCVPEGMLDLWHVESRTAALMVECEALFCFNGKSDGADGGGACLRGAAAEKPLQEFDFFGLENNFCWDTWWHLNSPSVYIFCLVVHKPCVFLMYLRLCVHALIHWAYVCVFCTRVVSVSASPWIVSEALNKRRLCSVSLCLSLSS